MAKIKSKNLYKRNSFYHLYNRGNNKRVIFHEENDYDKFLKNIFMYEKKYDLSIYEFCLMPNHFHLLVRLGSKRESISKYMHRCMTSYSMYFNRKYQTIGRLFQSPFQVKRLDSVKSIIRVLKYIENNPVEANIVKVPSEYRWLEILPKRKNRYI
jgi:REP element-mobilizing transposase RayT